MSILFTFSIKMGFTFSRLRIFVADRYRSIYNPVHPPDALIKNLTASNFKGLVDPKEAKKVSFPTASLRLRCTWSSMA